MEIMPNSTIKFLRNIPFDNDYNDTIYFDNPNQQYNYFAGVNGFNTKFVKYTIDKNYYARHSANVIDVELPNPDSGVDPTTGVRYNASTTESLYDCNYMMFCNESFKRVTDEGYALSKWFYAFITDVEYVNNQVARVTFEIDAMQTWMFDYELEQCFVEREHSKTDIEGENTINENLNLGSNYLTRSVVDKIASYAAMRAYIIYARETDTSYPTMRLIHGVPTTLGVRSYNLNTQLNDLANWLEIYLGSDEYEVGPDDIISIYLFPEKIVENDRVDGFADGDVINISKPPSFKYISPNKNTYYSPKNNKMYTSPFMFIEATNHEGTVEKYDFEYFRTNQDQQSPYPRRYNFIIKSVDAPSPSIALIPLNYLPSQSFENATFPDASLVYGHMRDGYEYAITISDFQQCAWVGDTFKAWWAQNKNSFVSSTLTGVGTGLAQLVAGVATENPYLIGMGAVTGIGSVYSSLAKVEDTKNKPPSVGGLSNTISLPISMNYFGFTVRSKTITGEQAEIIDEYFSMYGYATHRVKTPNRNVRERCTYTQTKGCTIKGRLPSKYQKQICKIYDNGIRFWNKDVQLGVYKNNQGELYPNRCLAELPNQ